MKPIVVTGHALHQARVRRHFPNHGEQQLKDRIRDEVAAAMAGRRVSNCVPPWAQLLSKAELCGKRPRPLQLRNGQRFVWDADEAHGWIVAREPDQVVVITSFHRVRSAAAVA